MAVYTSDYTGAEIDEHLNSVDALESNIVTLQTNVTTNTNNITTLQTQTNNNTNAITSLQTSVETNTNNITSLQTSVETNTNNITSLQTSVETNTNNITSLQTHIDGNEIFIQTKRDLATNLLNTNPSIGDGEIIYATDTGDFKIGNGIAHWNSLVSVFNSSPYSLTPNDTFNWYPGYYYCKKIIFKHKYITENLFEYPALISIVDDSDLGLHALSSGNDLRFTSVNGDTLHYEREEYSIVDGKCNAKLWVKIPVLYSEVDTVIYLFYGCNTAINIASKSDVWNLNYSAVWHLKETGTGVVGEFTDSTVNAYNSLNTSNQPTPTTGKIGTGQSFNGSSSYLNFGDISFALPFTIEVIVSPTENLNYGLICAKNGSFSSTGTGFYLRKRPYSHASKGFTFGIYDGIGNLNYVDSGPYNINDIYHIVAVADNNAISLYINGKLAAPAVTIEGFSPDSNSFMVGKYSYTNNGHIAAMLDELRISNTARSQSWIQTSYINIFHQSDIISIEPELSFTSTYIDHYRIYGAPYLHAGTPQQITITTNDQYNNIINYTGNKNLIFSGNYNPLISPVCRDSNGINVKFGEPTSIRFKNGIATSILTLFTAGNNKISVTDGVYSTENNTLNTAVYSNLPPVDIDFIIPSTVISGVESPVTISLRDIYGNITSGADITLSASSGSINLTSISSSLFVNGYYSGSLTVSGITKNSTIQITLTSGEISKTVNINVAGFSINNKFNFNLDNVSSDSVYVVSTTAEVGTPNLYVTTDYATDNACIQAALDSAPSGSTIIFRAGDYQINSQVSQTGKNLNLIGDGVVNFHVNFSGAVPGVYLLGEAGISTTLSVSSLKESTTLNLTSATDIVAGDIIKIYNNEFFAPDDTDYSTLRVGESYLVKARSGTTVTLETGLLRDYTTERESAIVSYHTVVINVKNLNFYGNGIEGTGVGLELKYCRNSSVSDCIFKDNGQTSIDFYACYNCEAYNNTISDSNYDNSGYGIVSMSTCNTMKYYNNDIRNCRHCIAATMNGIYGEHRDIFIFNNTLSNDNGKDDVIDSHQATINYIVFNNTIHLNNYGAFCDGTLHSLFQNNIVYGSGLNVDGRRGVVNRGHIPNTTKIITGNTFINCSCVKSGDPNPNVCKELVIANNYVLCDSNDFLVFLQDIKTETIRIYNNYVSGTFNAVQLYVGTAKTSNISIHNNQIDTCFGNGIYVQYESDSSGELAIYDNDLKNVSLGGEGYNGIEVRGSNNAVICNNTITDIYGKTLYGIYEHSNCSGNSIFNNASDGLTGGTLLRLGSNQINSGDCPVQSKKLSTLTVVSGNGSGIYELGSYVEVCANSPPVNKVFDKWIGDVGYLNNANTETTSMFIPDVGIVIEATYKDIPSVSIGEYITFKLNSIDTLGSTYLQYSGDKTLIFAGATGTCKNKTGTDINFGGNTVVTFINGVAECVFKFSTSGLKTINVTDGYSNGVLKINVV